MSKNIKNFVDFLNEAEGKGGLKSSITDFVKKMGVDKIEIDEISFAHRINDPMIHGTVYAGSKDVSDEQVKDDFYGGLLAILAEYLHAEIKKGGSPNGSGDMAADKLLSVLPGVKVSYEGEDVSPDSFISVHTSKDS